MALALVAGCSGSTDATSTAAGAPKATTTTTTTPSAVPDGEVAQGAAVPSAGCGQGTDATAELERHEIGDRFYLVSTPPSPDPTVPLPVVLDLHGLLEGAEVHATTSGFGTYAAKHDFIAVFPHGSGQPVGWQGSLDRSANVDLVFLAALLDQLEAERCIDTSRVYATGFSNGAIMSSILACTMADRIAAIAPVDGLMRPDGCDPQRPVPILAFHGTKDPILLFNGGVANLGSLLSGSGEKTEPPEADLNGEGYPATAARWAKANACTGDPTDADRTASVTERTWDCPADAPVVFEIMVDAGHSWPGSAFSQSIGAVVGPTDMSIDATELIWRFFQRFQLPTG